MYIYGRTKGSENITGFINSKWIKRKNKQPNFIFEGHEGNYILMSTIKSIDVGEDLLINYNLNRIDTNIVSMGVVCKLSSMTLIFYVYHLEWK